MAGPFCSGLQHLLGAYAETMQWIASEARGAIWTITLTI